MLNSYPLDEECTRLGTQNGRRRERKKNEINEQNETMKRTNWREKNRIQFTGILKRGANKNCCSIRESARSMGRGRWNNIHGIRLTRSKHSIAQSTQQPLTTDYGVHSARCTVMEWHVRHITLPLTLSVRLASIRIFILISLLSVLFRRGFICAFRFCFRINADSLAAHIIQPDKMHDEHTHTHLHLQLLRVGFSLLWLNQLLFSVRSLIIHLI